ncbi:universal stress protein [Roseivivax sediminis]|uniref:Nucleotide-binding universal stress protein, UspA family n=1 Tax=Roseivivax sediminis TaxID=936889 RepID=A0A1I1TCQ4_9RHOB|nr:universal stress protein [Roseivivax sediminis]SFD56427.1 Nucleotide-binding universal stress protein, UspA family [Roseivivax sediminis]
MFRNILVTIDLNDPVSWEKALPQAAELAKASGGGLHLLAVVPDMGMPLVEGFFPAHYEEHALTMAKAKLDELAREALPADTPHEQHVALGQITARILETAAATGADLIVMASHDPDLAQNFLIGGHAGKVVRRSPVSVLVVRE